MSHPVRRSPRTDRVAALIMGGFPPLDGPYLQMLQVSVATHRWRDAFSDGIEHVLLVSDMVSA